MRQVPSIVRPGAVRALLAALALSAALVGCGAAVPAPQTGTSVTVASPDSGISILQIVGAGLGGFSGLHVEGERLWLLSDRGFVVTADLAFDRRDRLAAVSGFAASRLCDENGMPLGSGIGDADAEALLRLADGSWLVAFERRHRIWRYSAAELAGCGAAEPFGPPLPPALFALNGNRGIEAMAMLPDGRLMIMAEDRIDGLHPYWIETGDGWQRGDYDGAPGFAPTDAVVTADGVLVLERYYTPLLGPDARITRLAPDVGGSPQELSRFSATGLPLDNYEGIARSARGLFVVSDDNFNAAQRTLLVHFIAYNQKE